MKLIGFAGYARTGKDTACELLGGRRIAFADALKDDLADIVERRYGLDPSALTPEQKEIIRPLYVAHGMIGRAIDPTMWISPALRFIDFLRRCSPQTAFGTWGALAPRGDGDGGHGNDDAPVKVGEGRPICVVDVRYPNEVRALLDVGARIIYIERPGYGPANEEESRSFYDIRNDQTLWSNVQTVVNDGTKEAFRTALKETLG